MFTHNTIIQTPQTPYGLFSFRHVFSHMAFIAHDWLKNNCLKLSFEISSRPICGPLLFKWENMFYMVMVSFL